MDDVKYNPKGEAGKQCKDCQAYEANANDPTCGNCHGHEVVAGGSCNFFTAKEATE